MIWTSGGYAGVFLIALGAVALAAAGLFKRIFRLDADYSGPWRTERAVVSSRRREDLFQGGKYRKTRIRNHYAAFVLEDGARVELWTTGRQYRRLSEGAAGRLTYQGSRLVKFE